MRTLRKKCYNFSPCALLAFNAGPIIIGFFGGLVGALIPLFIVEILSPHGGQYAITVLANMAAGVAAGIAAAAAKRPARIRVQGFDAFRANPGVVRVEVVASNESSVTARDVSLYISRVEVDGLEWLMTHLREQGLDNLYLVSLDAEKCCVCRGCVIEGVSHEFYRGKTGVRAPRYGLRVRGVAVSTMPPRSLLEAPLLEIEVVDVRSCVWEDCSKLRRCSLERVEELVIARVMSGGQVLGVYVSPLYRGYLEASIVARIEVSGDPVPLDDYIVATFFSIEEVEENEYMVKVEVTGEGGERLEKWFQVSSLKCSQVAASG